MTTPDYLLLFDIDGTLLRTKGAGREATRLSMLEVFGTASTIATHHFGGKPDWYTLVELLSNHGYTRESIQPLLPQFEAAMGRNLSQTILVNGAQPCPGALELIHRLRVDSRYMLGIVTGNAQASGNVKLQAAGYDPIWFTVGAYGTESVDRNDLPRLALERARAHCACDIQPQRVIVVGDTLKDIESARALGAVAVAVTTGFEARHKLVAAKPDYLLDDLTGFMSILD